MAKAELLSYIEECQKLHIDRAQIKAELLKFGWLASDIDEAWLAVNSAPAVRPAVSPESEKAKKMPRPASSKRRKIILIISAVLGAALLVSAGVYAYFYYFPSPQDVVLRMMGNLSSIHSLTYDTELQVTYQVDNSLTSNPLASAFITPQSTSSPSTASPVTASSTPGTPTGATNANHLLTIDLGGQTDFTSHLKNAVTFSFHSDELLNNAVFGAEIRSIEKMIYVKLNLPKLSIIDLSSLNSEWIGFDSSSTVDNLAKQQGVGNSASSTAKFNQAAYALKSAQVKNLLISEVFRLTKVLPSDIINNSPTYHYSFSIDKAGLENVLDQAVKLLSDPQALAQNQAQLAQFKTGLAQVKSINGEIWIGRHDFRPYKLVLNLDMAVNNPQFKIEKISFSVATKNFNQPLAVTAPTSYKTFGQIIQEFLGSALGGNTGGSSSTSTLNAATSTLNTNNTGNNLSGGLDMSNAADTDGDGLSNVDEVNTYHTDPLNPDTDGDGYSDGVEVRGGYNPNGPGKLTGF